MGQFVQTHSGGKALLYECYKYERSMMETSEHFGDARGTRANAQQEWLPINLYRERSAFHISHNHERRCTCLFVHLFMQKLTIDFVGSWFNGSWPGVRFPCGSCDKAVRANQQDGAVLCNGCEKKFHKMCIYVNREVYLQLGRSDDQWHCATCQLPAFRDSYFEDTRVRDTSAISYWCRDRRWEE